MRKKGRAHPDRVEATQTHQTLRKTLQEIEAAMNASDPEKARALLLGIADHLTAALDRSRETILESLKTAPTNILSRDAWIAAAKSGTPWPLWLVQAQERDPDLVLEPKMTWRALFGSSAEKVDAYVDALAREAMGDALGAIGPRLVKSIEPDDAGRPAVRLDLDALEDVAKTIKSKFVAFVLPPAAREGLDGEPTEQGNQDCCDRGAMPCVPRMMLKNAVAHLRDTAKDPCAWVDAKIVWTVTRPEMMRLPGGPQNARLVYAQEQQLDAAGETDVECQELLVLQDEINPAFVVTPETPNTYVHVPVYGPIQRLPAQMRADLVLRWVVLRDDGRQRDGYIRLAGRLLALPQETVDIVHTIKVALAARKEAA